MELAIIIAALLLVSFLYSSVGHGGASGYIAVFTLFSLAPLEIRNNALILNIVVSSIAFFHFYKQGHFNPKVFLILILLSIPAAYLGGSIKPNLFWYKILLGTALAVAALVFIFKKNNTASSLKQMPTAAGLFIGAALGFLSGITGIGGGVFLSPILLFFNWANQKQTAALSSGFILVNSIAGLLGSFKEAKFEDHLIFFAAACIVGGLLGSKYGSGKWSERTLKYMLSAVLLLASAKLFSTVV